MPYKDPAKQKEAVHKWYVANSEKVKEASRKWHAANREKKKEARRKWDAANPEKHMLMGARQRARKDGWPFDISVEDIAIPENCPVLGIPLSRAVGRGSDRDNSPSLDRTVPELGYVKGNVAVISNRANRIKTDATPEEMLKVALHFQEIPPYVYSCDGFVPGKTPVQYSGPFFDHRETGAAVKALLHGKWATSGEQVVRFQNEFGRRFKTRHCHMVNSGSSANLVMLAALKKRFGWQQNAGIMVSPVGFPTTIAPIVQNGMWPLFADIEMETLNFDLDHVERILELSNKTEKLIEAIFISPVLGNPPNMDRLADLALRYDVKLIADNCDSLGTKWGEYYWHEACVAWSTSFYPAHHMTTGEGGMICSNDSQIIDTARSISWWGRDCYCVGAANLLPCGTCGKRFSDWLGDGSEIDHKYVFSKMGYNLKPLDLQGAIGLEQLKKFDEIEKRRRANADRIKGMLASVPGVRPAQRLERADPCWFGVPIICDTAEIRKSLVQHLETNLIQTRPYFAGNILRHPGYSHLGAAGAYPNANSVLDRVFFLGCPPQYSVLVLEYIEKTLCAWQPPKS